MNSQPSCPHPCRRARLGARVLCALALALVLCPAANALAAEPAASDEPERAVTPSPARTVLVKALGRGHASEDAEKDAIANARAIAAKHAAAQGAALDPAGQRVVGAHRFPVLGFGEARAVALVEFRLRGLDEPPPAGSTLPALTLSHDAGTLVIEASRPCEAILVIEPKAAPEAKAPAEPEILPGGGGAAFRLAPGKPLRQALPKTEGRLFVLACTGGLNPPVAAPTLEGVLSLARDGRPHPAVLQGVVSECVTVQDHVAAGVLRSIRQKGSEAPVNMTGAAGREGGMPVVKDAP